MYIPCIFQEAVYTWYIPGIYNGYRNFIIMDLWASHCCKPKQWLRIIQCWSKKWLGSVILLQNFISKIPCIYMTYTKYMHGICHTYTRCSDLSVLTGFKAAINVGWTVNTCTLHGILGQQLDSTQKAWFIVIQDIPGIFLVYTLYILCIFHVMVTC
jgi:hypothetical protein